MMLTEALASFDNSMMGILSDHTRRWYRGRLATLREFFGDRALEGLGTVDLRAWRAWLIGRDLSPWTLHGYGRAVKRFFKWLTLEGAIAHNPADLLRLPKLPAEPPKAIDNADLVRILEAAQCSGPRDLALVLFLADTGARVGGAATLTIKDLELGRGRAVVREKGQKARTVYLSGRTVAALNSWLTVRPAAFGDAVFIGQRGPLTPGGIYQVFKKLAVAGGITGRCNPHSLRHGWARSALARGADLKTVSDILGHSDITTTARFYARWADDELAERHRQFSPIGAGDPR